MDKKSFVLYQDYLQHLNRIDNDSHFRVLIETIFKYADGQQIDEDVLSDKAQMAFSFISANLDRDLEKYQKRCKKNKEIADGRWKE